MSIEQEIRDLFAKNSVPLSRDDVWSVQGTPVVRHKALERLAGALDIVWRAPTIVRAEREEAVILVMGVMGDNEGFREEWSIGEAAVNVNYKVTGRQAAYVYAMAEKRGKDRVILKLAKLHGAYSEEEADDFKEGRPAEGGAETRQEVMKRAIDSNDPVDTGDGVVTAESALARKLEGIRAKIESHKRTDTLEALMKSEDTQAVLRCLDPGQASELRTYAWTRLKALRDSAQAASGPSAYARAKEGV